MSIVAGRPRKPESELLSVREEIAIARMAVECLLNCTASEEELIRRTPTLIVWLEVIERLVATAHQLILRDGESEVNPRQR